MKTVMITGASSQIGDFLLPLLQKDSYQVVAISRTQQSSHDVQWIKANISEPKTMSEAFIGADVFIHIAPLALLPPLLPAIKEKGIKRIIAFGTTSMFAKKQSHTLIEQKTVAELELAEKAIHDYCQQENIHWTIFRPTLIYGCGKDKNISFVAKTMKKYHFFPIVGQASGLRQPVHTHDLAQACLQVINNPNTYDKAYNLSGHEILSYKDMLERVIDVQQQTAWLVPIPLFLFRILVKVAHIMPAYRYLTPDMANRMNQDLCFDHQAASEDFDYKPRSFQPPKV
ncbi:MAG: NAD-dependent epimerase/dehydratase family protein [Mariprofundaceae bacterium]|nr:NAD-dependent epimerase/dehydratase family protein [Mariprofundaceae bacterium]